MGSAEVQGQLWGKHARDWAECTEQGSLPLHSAVLDAARVTRGVRLLDAGCGTGLVGLLASLRGAHVSVIDASAALLEIARARLPDADVRQGDIEALPFADATFDAVTAVNSVFYATDMAAAMRELVRVTRPGGRVVVTAWGPPERCEYLSAALQALGPLMPPPPPNAPAGGPGALSAPGALAAVVTAAGLRVAEQGETACPYILPNAEVSWRWAASAGPTQRAIAHSGEAAVHAAVAEADRAHMRSDGSIHFDNVFLWVAGERS